MDASAEKAKLLITNVCVSHNSIIKQQIGTSKTWIIYMKLRPKPWLHMYMYVNLGWQKTLEYDCQVLYSLHLKCV
jgi:hypothetical protein